jgi:Transmembrane amino acid transporter protein.
LLSASLDHTPFCFGKSYSHIHILIFDKYCTKYMFLCFWSIRFSAIKSSFFELTHKGRQVSEKFNKMTTRSLLAIVTGTALVVTDAGIVVSLSGAVMGSAIIYAFPSIVFLKTTSRLISQGKLRRTSRLAVERFANECLVGTGGLIAVLGGAVILIRKFRPGLM